MTATQKFTYLVSQFNTIATSHGEQLSIINNLSELLLDDYTKSKEVTCTTSLLCESRLEIMTLLGHGLDAIRGSEINTIIAKHRRMDNLRCHCW